MIASSDQPLISRHGIGVAIATAAVAFAGFMHLASPGRPGWLAVVTIWAAAGGLLIAVSRATMPGKLRMPLVLALVATMMFGAARADLFGGHRLADQVAKSTDEAEHGQAAPGQYAGAMPQASAESAGGGAAVAVVGGRAGGDAWAKDLNATWGNKLGGAAAEGLRISGSVDRNEVRDGLSWVAVDWEISRDFVTARCGRTTATGRDRKRIVDALGQPMAQAVARSLDLRRAACP